MALPLSMRLGSRFRKYHEMKWNERSTLIEEQITQIIENEEGRKVQNQLQNKAKG